MLRLRLASILVAGMGKITAAQPGFQSSNRRWPLFNRTKSVAVLPQLPRAFVKIFPCWISVLGIVSMGSS